MYISRVLVKNVRCFEELEIKFDLNSSSPPWAMIVGDNATGKTTLLRCIAIGLCDESSAASLLKETEEGYNRRGAKEPAEIIIRLSDPHESEKPLEIKTIIEKFSYDGAKRDYIERVRQETDPLDNFPWTKLFICAYGAGRGTSGTGDIAGYSVINSVYNLFNYSEGLQNPELTIRRLEGDFSKNEVFQILHSLLPETKRPDLATHGITVGGPWGPDMPLRELADGYKSTFLWVTDFLGWALSHDPKLQKSNEISGVVLVDELEQHLHPKWQRIIVSDLRKQFPKIQFITTTHSPIVASSIGQIDEEIERDRLIHLNLEEGNRVVPEEIKESMKGYRADQVLASKAFDYFLNEDPEVARILREASKLESKGSDRTKIEEERYQNVKNAIKRIFRPDGQAPIERVAQDEIYKEMKKNIKELEKKLFGDEA